jgi:hypothetical protein
MLDFVEVIEHGVGTTSVKTYQLTFFARFFHAIPRNAQIRQFFREFLKAKNRVSCGQ